MDEITYLFIIKAFMCIMPFTLTLISVFAWSCITSKATDQPAFWLSLICIGILLGEIVRGWLILNGVLPPHPKDVTVWIMQMIPFGGLVYAILERYWKKMATLLKQD